MRGEGLKMIDHMVKPVDGRHPQYPHLVMAEFDREVCSWVMTIEGVDGDVLIGEDDLNAICGDDEFIRENEFGYISDEYIAMIERERE
jgi:hypothetical protein